MVNLGCKNCDKKVLTNPFRLSIWLKPLYNETILITLVENAKSGISSTGNDLVSSSHRSFNRLLRARNISLLSEKV